MLNILLFLFCYSTTAAETEGDHGGLGTILYFPLFHRLPWSKNSSADLARLVLTLFPPPANTRKMPKSAYNQERRQCRGEGQLQCCTENDEILRESDEFLLGTGSTL